MVYKLSDFSIVSGTQPKPKNACGGLLTLVVLPCLAILYSITWLNTWFNGNLGVVQETTIDQIQFGAGFKFRGDQELYCMARSGCWYTRYKVAEGNKCPPVKAIQTMAAKSAALNQLFDTGKLGTLDVQLPEKECAYVPYESKLERACAFATPDPIDKLTVTWKVDTTTSNRLNFGVALKTQSMRKTGHGDYRQEDEEDEVVSIAGAARKWFRWSTDGGGVGYNVMQTGTELHYGEIELQPLNYHYEFATPTPDAMQLVPKYSHTNGEPTATNLCYSELGSNPVLDDTRCQDEPSANRECVQLKLGMAPTRVTEMRTVVSPVGPFLGALGGIVGIIIAVLTVVNSTLATLCSKHWMLRPSSVVPPVSKDIRNEQVSARAEDPGKV